MSWYKIWHRGYQGVSEGGALLPPLKLLRRNLFSKTEIDQN